MCDKKLPPRAAMVLTYCCASLFGLLCYITSVQFVHASEYIGPVIHIVDGDTFDIRASEKTLRIRLCGIDTPERGKTGFTRAMIALTALINGKTVRCVQVGGGTPCDGRSKPTNRHRIVAQCFIEKKDIASELIRMRVACDWPKFSGSHYHLDPSTCINRH